MKKTHRMLLVTSCFLLAAMGAFALTGCGGGTSNSSDPKALYESKCGTCHSLATVDNAKYTTAEEWIANVKSMQAKSSKISDEDAAEITAYLAGRQGK
ncbi:MAG: cytochrome c [Raoultibacter sp.]